MKRLIVANWKANPDAPGRAELLARKIDYLVSKKVDVVIAPPFPFLERVGRVLKHAKLGAQSMFWEDIGPWTGEVSWHQLRPHLKVQYVIIGHSERRSLGETDEMIAKKVKAAHYAGLKAILCVGEPKKIRSRGFNAAVGYVENQLKRDLAYARPFANYPFIIAYEPIWAIGSGKADDPKESAEMARRIKKWCAARSFKRTQVLYGGSVKAANARAFFAEKDIDGALVGGASLVLKEFAAIIRAAVR